MPTEPLAGNSVLIEELDSPHGGPPLRVVLEQRDAPLGGRGSGGAFDVTPKLRQVVTRYPGQTTPSRQIMGTEWEPVTFRGNLQDRGVVGRARSVAESLHALVARARRVRLTWGPWTFFGVVSRAKVSPEGLRDYNYEVEVDLDGPDLPSTALAVSPPPPPAPSPSAVADLGATALALGGDPVTEAGGRLPAAEAVGLAEAQLAHATAVQALLAITDAVSDANALTPQDAGRLVASGTGAAAASFGYAMALQNVPGPVVGGWAGMVTWQKARMFAAESAFDLAGGCADTCNRVEDDARGEAEATHDVRDGETLESIARRRLGSEARAWEIQRRNNLPGMRPAPGSRLLLPAR